eukprot:4936341-Pleurochrysis_carterae.AAC.2
MQSQVAARAPLSLRLAGMASGVRPGPSATLPPSTSSPPPALLLRALPLPPPSKTWASAAFMAGGYAAAALALTTSPSSLPCATSACQLLPCACMAPARTRACAGAGKVRKPGSAIAASSARRNPATSSDCAQQRSRRSCLGALTLSRAVCVCDGARHKVGARRDFQSTSSSSLTSAPMSSAGAPTRERVTSAARRRPSNKMRNSALRAP